MQHPINRKLVQNLAFQGVQALNIARHFDHVLAHTAVFVHTRGEEQLGSFVPLRLCPRCKTALRSVIISNT
jgi:hypothetical protein